MNAEENGVSTASASDSSDDRGGVESAIDTGRAKVKEAESIGDIEIKATEALVFWSNDEGKRQCSRNNPTLTDHFDGSGQVTMALHHKAATGEADFRLQADVAYTSPPQHARNRRSGTGPLKRKTLFLLIPTDSIRALSLVRVEDDDNAECGLARVRLGNGIHTLDFELTRPPSFVVPLDHEHMRLKNKASHEIFNSLRSLATQTRFTVHLRSSVMTRICMSSLCRSVSLRLLKKMPQRSDVSRFYGGRGGKVWEPFNTSSSVVAGIHPETGAATVTGTYEQNPLPPPPAYDEAGPAPLSPPVWQRPGRRKRRRADSSDADVEDDQNDSKSSHRPRQAGKNPISKSEDTMLARIDAMERRVMARLDAIEQMVDHLRDDVSIYRQDMEDVRETIAQEVDERMSDRENDYMDWAHRHVAEVVDEKMEGVGRRVRRYIRGASVALMVESDSGDDSGEE